MSALVTGGAQGIGAACAAALAADGHAVAVTDVDGDAAARVAAELGGGGIGFAADVTDPDAMAAAVARTEAELGPLTTLVHSAGGLGRAATGPLVDLALDDFDAVVDLNLRGTFLTCQAAARAMLAHANDGDRSIVVIASLQGLVASPHLVSYATAKAGVTHLVRTLALELAPAGIRVNAVAPSITDTPSVRARVSEERRRASEAAIPLGRIGRAEDVAGLAAVLASPVSSFVTGQTWVVDGGLSLTTARPTRAQDDGG